jgi:hypothetical protein
MSPIRTTIQIFLPGANRYFLKYCLNADWGGVHGEPMMFIDAEWLCILPIASTCRAVSTLIQE